MRNKSYNFYLWLVDHRDKNSYIWGFTPMGYVWQALVYIYGWVVQVNGWMIYENKRKEIK